MARWTQPHEVREYARVAHAYIDALSHSMNILVLGRDGSTFSGRLTAASMSQDIQNGPARYAGEFTLEGDDGRQVTFDLIDVKDVYPHFTLAQVAAKLS